MTIKCNVDRWAPIRTWDHMYLGLAGDIGPHNKNIGEKLGNLVLWPTDMIPRVVRAIHRSTHDPRVVTIAITALALVAASYLFYPVATYAAIKFSATALGNAFAHIPFWSVHLATYIAVCANIVGAGLRSGGRFCNADLMKAFYGLPASYPDNPASLTNVEILELLKQKLP